MDTGFSKRLTSSLVALGLALCVQAEQWSPFGIGVLPLKDAQYPAGNASVYGLNLSLLVGNHNRMYGLSLGALGYMGQEVAGLEVGVFNLAETAPYGVLQTGLYNIILEEGCGMQVGWYNTTDAFTGLQIGVLNIPSKAEENGKNKNGKIDNDVSGAQIGLLNASIMFNGIEIGAANMSKTANGVQIGALNGSVYFCGAQIGAFDIAREEIGFQLGVFNYAGKMSGVQIGAVNVASREFRGVQLGAVNILANGKTPFLPILRVTLD